MAIQISGTTVIDNSRNLTNVVNITASGSISGNIIATQGEAEAGTSSTKLMTPQRVAQAIAALGGNVINRIQRGSSSYSPSTAPPASGGYTIAVPITSVNTSKSFISQAWRGLNAASGTNFQASSRLSNSTTLTVEVPYSPPASGTVDWEVIEFK